MTIVDALSPADRGPPTEPEHLPAAWLSNLQDYCQLLEAANGFILHGGAFRAFGVGAGCLGRDAAEWNNAPWRERYRLPPSLVIWGENVFGDQYGFDIVARCLTIVRCEGGTHEQPQFPTIGSYLEGVLATSPAKWIELALIGSAARKGLRPTIREHLSFVLPLICGGRSDENNLEVLDGAAHLDVLGQMMQQTAKVPSGTPIRGFRAE